MGARVVDAVSGRWTRVMGGAVLAGTGGFIGWVVGVAFGVHSARAVQWEPGWVPGAGPPAALVPLRGVALAPLTSVPGRPAPAPADTSLRLEDVVRPEGSWEAFVAQVAVGPEGPVRSYGVGDRLPEGSVVVAVERDGIWRFGPDSNLEFIGLDGSRTILDDFDLPPVRRMRRLPAPDPALIQAIRDTLHLAGHGEPEAAQQAFDALVEAGEPVVRLLAERADATASLPGVPLWVGGQRLRPRFEGQLVQWILQTITEERFGRLRRSDLSASEVEEQGWAWKSWLGVE